MTNKKILSLSIIKIRTDGGTQPRERIDQGLVNDYADILGHLPPVIVFFDGSQYWLGDGFHRLRAHVQAGRKHIEAEVIQGDQREAILFSVGANARHGWRRSREDARRAVWTLLADPEWTRWSNMEIARTCAVSEYLVRVMRHEIELAAREERERQRAKEEGSSSIKSKMDTPEQAPQTRQVERGGTVYPMDIGAIGRKPGTADKAPTVTCPACGVDIPMLGG